MCRASSGEIGCGITTANTMSLRHLGHGAVVSLVAAWSMTAYCPAGIKIPVHPVRERAIQHFRKPGPDPIWAAARENSTEPVARPRPPAPGSIGRICQRASVNRNASASDALRQQAVARLEPEVRLFDVLWRKPGATEHALPGLRCAQSGLRLSRRRLFQRHDGTDGHGDQTRCRLADTTPACRDATPLLQTLIDP